MGIKVRSEVKPYEVGGKDAPVDAAPLAVESHWNREEFVVLHYCGMAITVSASHLKAAVENATRTAKY